MVATDRAMSISMLERARYFARHVGITAFAYPFMNTWHKFLLPSLAPTRDENKELDRRYRELLDRDLANVRAGWYSRDLLFEFPAGEYLRLIPNGVFEFPRIWWRRARDKHEDLPPVENRDHYPDYYLRNFHWQTDGWLSDHSAKMYDLSVETLFLGTADIMRRMALPPLVRALRDCEHPRVLDVACGTGRFLRHLSATVPSAKLYGVDLSPNYLRRANEVLAGVPGVSLVADNAENLPFKDESFDAVSSVFLFHELPKDARRNVMREMRRVVRPGGTVVILDSAQFEESEKLRAFLEGFPAIYHEPYYKGYLHDSLGRAMEECGLEVVSSVAHFVSKVVVAVRPNN